MNDYILYGLIIIAILVFLISCKGLGRKKKHPDRFKITFFLSPFKISGTNMALTLTSVQQAQGQVQPMDIKGNPAPVETGSVEYSIADSAVATIEEDPNDETKFTVKAVAPGVTQLTVKADADLGEGVTSIETFAAIEVTPAGAVGFGIVFGTPEDQPTT